MPEYVYALHDFLPEYEDEVFFHAGELIEVIEKDDKYGDGWWRGRSLAGGVGLFPVSYTAPGPSSTNTSHALNSPESVSESHGISTSNRKFVLQPLTEESETEFSGINILSPAPKHSTTLFNSDYDTELPYEGDSFHNHASRDNKMMKATMVDVQKAIEQLGRDDVGEDSVFGARSFSTRDEENTENSDTDIDLSDFDGTGINGNDKDDWRKDARRKLAAKAKRAMEEAEMFESMTRMGDNENGRRTLAPPIEVDFSEESEVEDDAELTRPSDFHRNHPHIPEKDENLDTDGEATAAIRYSLSTDIFVPPNDETDVPTATKASFSDSPSSLPTEPLREEPEEAPPIKKDIYPSSYSPDLTKSSKVHRNHSFIPEEDENVGTDGEATAATSATRYSALTDVFVPPKDETDIRTATEPSFSASQSPVPTEPLLEEPEEKPPSIGKDICPCPISPPMTLPNIQQILKRSSTPIREISNGLLTPASVGDTGSKNNSLTSPSSTPGMLVNALQVQQQRPNGTSLVIEPASIPVSTTAQGRNETPLIEWNVKDVVDWLKSKGFDQNVCDRFIEQEISGDVLLELDINLLKSEIGIMAFGKRMRIANAITDLRRPPSLEYSDHQLSPTQLHHSNSLTESHSRTQSQSVSLPGTTPATTIGHVHWNSFGSPGAELDGHLSGHLQNSPVNINDDIKAAGSAGMEDGAGAAGVGRGIALSPINAPSEKRPPRLLLAPSNAALKEAAAKAIAVNGEDEERGYMSDGEIVLNSTRKRPRTFGVSHESAVSSMSNNVKGKETSDKDTPIIGLRRARSWRSVGNKTADRLTIFGATFGSNSGKRRKPPPGEDTLTEKASKFILPKLHISTIHRSLSTTSHRPANSNGAPPKSLLNLNFNVTAGINANVPKSFHGVSGFFKQGVNIFDRIGEPDHTGWMRKRGNRNNSWKRRYFILKGPHLYFLKSDNKSESRIKGYILIVGYKVTVDESVDPGRFGFRIDHDHDQTHYFSSKERSVVREWMKAIMKATISRDNTRTVISSCNIPTIPLVVAQAMDPAPRPPSPSAREAIQMALRRDNTEQLSKRDTLVLGFNAADVKDGQARIDSFSSKAAISEGESNPSSPKGSAPPRPSRQLGRMSSVRSVTSQTDDSLIKWANGHLPESLQINDSTSFLSTGLGLGLLRLAESIKGQPSSPPVPDFAFPADIHDDNLDGIFRLFDFLLNNDVKMGSVSINDVRLGRRDKIIQLLKALKGWEDKLKAHTLSINLKGTSPAPVLHLC